MVDTSLSLWHLLNSGAIVALVMFYLSNKAKKDAAASDLKTKVSLLENDVKHLTKEVERLENKG